MEFSGRNFKNTQQTAPSSLYYWEIYFSQVGYVLKFNDVYYDFFFNSTGSKMLSWKIKLYSMIYNIIVIYATSVQSRDYNTNEFLANFHECYKLDCIRNA